MASLQDAKQLAILRLLTSAALQDANSAFVVTLLDSFLLDGPNGRHPCLVLEPMGPSISSVLNAPRINYDPRHPQPRRFPTEQTKAIVRNVLCGLAFLHGNGVVHGDLQLGNTLFAIRDLAAVRTEKLQQDKANSRTEVLKRKDGKIDKWAPKYLIVSDPLQDYVLQGAEQVVKIIDMGGGAYKTNPTFSPFLLTFLLLLDLAFLENDPPQSIATPVALRAPEVILGGAFG